MNKAFSSIGSSASGDLGKAVLFASLAGVIMSGIVPNPGQALYTLREKKLNTQWKDGVITSQQYWDKAAQAHYMFTPLWWTAVLGIVYFVKGDVAKKTIVAASLIGVGAVVGLVFNNRSRDIEEVRNEILADMAFKAVVEEKRLKKLEKTKKIR